MNTPTGALDLTKLAPHSPRERLAGFVIDKCRASLAGTLGEYHYNSPLDNRLFTFKGINCEQFNAAVQASGTNGELGAWLLANGTPRTADEIKAWSDEMEAVSP